MSDAQSAPSSRGDAAKERAPRPAFTLPLLLLGAATGTAGVFGYGVVRAAITGWTAAPSLELGVLSMVAVFSIWVAGLLIIGWPLWTVMHRLGLTSGVHAAGIGFLPPAMVVVAISLRPDLGASDLTVRDAGGDLIIHGVRTLHGWLDMIWSSALLGLNGAAVGLVLWFASKRLLNGDPADSGSPPAGRRPR